jgi:hypothetical protein
VSVVSAAKKTLWRASRIEEEFGQFRYHALIRRDNQTTTPPSDLSTAPLRASVASNRGRMA